jgi:hypothetical protein
MNKLLKSLLFFMAISLTVNAQDNPTSLKELSSGVPSDLKSLNFRIFAGPEMCFLLSGDNSTMKGGKLGANAGIELNKSFSKKVYGVFGAGIATGGFERWINNDPSVKSKESYDQYTNLEVPIGVGFNLGSNSPKGFFAQLTAVNSITLKSVSNYTIVPLKSFEAQSNSSDKTFDRFNMGAKLELGVKTHFEKKCYSSFSLSAKTMFLNRFSTNTNQYTTLNIAALFGFYF